jgi:hypothetical protein
MIYLLVLEAGGIAHPTSLYSTLSKMTVPYCTSAEDESVTLNNDNFQFGAVGSTVNQRHSISGSGCRE